jgi:hypothetical protein
VKPDKLIEVQAKLHLTPDKQLIMPVRHQNIQKMHPEMPIMLISIALEANAGVARNYINLCDLNPSMLTTLLTTKHLFPFSFNCI